MIQEKKCYHPRIKKNYRHGRNSNPTMYCKKCNEVITRFKLKELKRTKRKNGRNKRK